MPLSLGFGFGSSKSSTNIDPQTRGLMFQNYYDAQGLPGTYTPTSADQINSYLSPYTQDVIDQSMGDADRYRQMMVNETGDAATAAHAFGGSRHGVAEALTNQGAMQQFGLLASQLRNQGFGQALQTAQNENQYRYQYPLARQGLLNSALAGITPNVTQKGSQMGANIGWSGGGGGK